MITLSRRQVKDADRIGGIELMILWPESLGPEPAVLLDYEREAHDEEHAMAEWLVGASCKANGLVPVHTRIVCVRRPPGVPGEHEERVHLAVTIIGRRWVHASTKNRGRVAFATMTCV